jgi:hypothetical protein
MAVKSCYELLEIAPTASPDEIRRAFRRALARYHPDKVQHLGVEFQDIAAAKTAEITKAYRTLRDPAGRANYDSQSVGTAVTPEWGLTRDRAEAKELVRRAALGRFRHVLRQEFGSCEETPIHGFDVVGGSLRMWRRGSQLRVLGRLVADVDAAAVEDTWVRAQRIKREDPREVCLFLMGAAIAPVTDLGRVIDDLRRRSARAGGTLMMVPVDISTWSAHVPADAPAVVRKIVERLQAA